ncbi:hypothetical protein [Burkholderia cepacia]|uniref:Uncharacterized protein n=1 Tax=Burkholderia cepacia TaxID=292 RepID=A0A8I1ARX8_BURCE|nr:hypothetical protein [Burkholderia cepacia]MBH9696200.1 hypothetical protein [Burkholderia cepacia]MBH9712770.1 hypothetical protein [Burkholderia cepacia]MBX3762367.1 hypothetical protein [Burkholderia cepacia]MBX3800907.1 hypothetical protein [Burkholderia cepacia]MBX3910411.1 hypothetical protein [Burkholderia cepacia]
MISSKTYLKIKNEFVDFHTFDGEIQDPNYIEGAIELSVSGVVLLDKSMWDCVDQLWAYLIEGLVCVSRGEEFKVCFPDQPIEIKFYVHGGSVVFSVAVHETIKVVVDRSEFVSEMKRFAVEFFEDLKGKGERFGALSDFYLNKLNSI